MAITDNTVSRRDLAIWSAGGLALVAAPIAAARMAKPADKGELAFNLWKATYQAINTAPDADMDNGNDEIRWNTLDRLEADILADTTPTARAAERKMWVALAHDGTITDAPDNEAISKENLGHLLKHEANFDWNVRLHIAAIVTLRRAQGVA